MEKMRHHGTNGKNDGKMEGILMDLDERTVKTVAKMGDYVSMGERLVLFFFFLIVIVVINVDCMCMCICMCMYVYVYRCMCTGVCV